MDLKKPVGRISDSSSSRSAPARSSRCRITRDQEGHHEVDALVGALCREDRRDQQFEGIVVDEGAQVLGRSRIGLREAIGDLAGTGERTPSATAANAPVARDSRHSRMVATSRR